RARKCAEECTERLNPTNRLRESCDGVILLADSTEPAAGGRGQHRQPRLQGESPPLLRAYAIRRTGPPRDPACTRSRAEGDKSIATSKLWPRFAARQVQSDCLGRCYSTLAARAHATLGEGFSCERFSGRALAGRTCWSSGRSRSPNRKPATR